MAKFWVVTFSGTVVTEGKGISSPEELSLQSSILSVSSDENISRERLKSLSDKMVQSMLECGNTVSVKKEEDAIYLNCKRNDLLFLYEVRIHKYGC